jgi:hypothetical protein
MENTKGSSSEATSEIARVAVRLPSFWAERPASWFTQAEAQFHLVGISNELTKFYHVVSQLDERYVAEVDIIDFPPQHDHYTTLRQNLSSGCAHRETSALASFSL